MRKLFLPKGVYGYIKNHRILATVRTLLYFGVSIGLYVMGYVTTGSNRNLLTVVAVLGCLPACKSLVNLLIFLKAAGCSEALREKVSRFDGQLTTFYDMYFTSYQKDYAISHMALQGNVLCGVTEQAKCDANGAEKHIEQMLSQEGIKNITVKIYTDPGKYVDRLGQIIKLDAEKQKNHEQVVNLLFSIVL